MGPARVARVLPAHRRDRGVALLIVLASILIVSTASIAALRVTLVARTRAEFDRDAALAAEVVRSSEPAILNWLVSSSRGIVLPTTAMEPRVTVLHDRFVVGDADGETNQEIEIRIDAFDVYGRAPFAVMKKGGILRDLVPRSIAEEFERAGIDALGAESLDDLVSLTGSNPFPVLGDAPRTAQDEPIAPGVESRDLRIGSILSHDNPYPGFLNVQTAPVAYLEAVFSQQKRGGFSKWILPRERGERISVPSSAGAAGDHQQEDVPRLIGESTAWNFRIDVRVGRVTRAYWALYEAGSAMEWICSARSSIP